MFCSYLKKQSSDKRCVGWSLCYNSVRLFPHLLPNKSISRSSSNFCYLFFKQKRVESYTKVLIKAVGIIYSWWSMKISQHLSLLVYSKWSTLVLLSIYSIFHNLKIKVCFCYEIIKADLEKCQSHWEKFLDKPMVSHKSFTACYKNTMLGNVLATISHK